jgi:hypothetical protein
MDEFEFQVVDDDKRRLAGMSLERLRALAPTFPERSRQRLACVELIAEREGAMARAAVRKAMGRAAAARRVAWVAVVVAAAGWGLVGWMVMAGGDGGEKEAVRPRVVEVPRREVPVRASVVVEEEPGEPEPLPDVLRLPPEGAPRE